MPATAPGEEQGHRQCDEPDIGVGEDSDAKVEIDRHKATDQDHGQEREGGEVRTAPQWTVEEERDHGKSKGHRDAEREHRGRASSGQGDGGHGGGDRDRNRDPDRLPDVPALQHQGTRVPSGRRPSCTHRHVVHGAESRATGPMRIPPEPPRPTRPFGWQAEALPQTTGSWCSWSAKRWSPRRRPSEISGRGVPTRSLHRSSVASCG